MSRRIVLATSLAPRIERRLSNGETIGHLYQYLCLRSWRESGFEIISVNAASEVEAVRAEYPEIDVVPAQRDARDWCGRPLVPVAEMIRIVRETNARHGGIVNADVFAGAPGLADRLPFDRDVAMVFASRTEVSHPYSRTGDVYRYGFDAFFFDVAAASGIDLEPFTIGLPWWDYALPTAFLVAGLRSLRAVNFPLGHISHRSGWDQAQWTRFFTIFLQRFRPGFDALMRGRSSDLPALTGLKTIEQIVDLYDRYESRHGLSGTDDSVSHRYRLAYSVAAVDLLNEMAPVWDFETQAIRESWCR